MSQTYTLFNRGLPGGTTSTSVTARTDGIQFTVSASGTLAGQWWYVPSSETVLAGSSHTILLWTTTTGTTGTLVTSNVGSGTLTAGAWNFIPFTSPPTLSPGTTYVMGHSGHGWLQFEHNMWGAGNTFASGVTSGPVFAPPATSALNSAQQPTVGTANTFPPSASTNSWYGIDVSFVTSAITVTATQTGGSTKNGTGLYVEVVTGAAKTQNGATATNDTTITTPQLSITPNASGSWVYAALSNRAAATAYTANASTTLDMNLTDATNTVTYGAGRTTATTTAATPVTVGASAPTETAGTLGIALAEILNATGKTLAKDASTPAAVDNTAGLGVTTGWFIPPAGSLLVATVSTDWAGAGAVQITMSDTWGLQWTKLAQSSTTGTTAVYIARMPGIEAFTITATQTGSTAVGTAGSCIVVTGQASSPIGATTSIASTTSSLAITPTGTGSYVYGSILGLIGTYTLNGSTSLKQDHPGQGLEYLSIRSTATTTASTPVTLGASAQTANGISESLLEILAGPNGLHEDASTPAAFSSTTITVTSAAFAPPPGSILVVMLQTNGAAGTVNATITDNSGLGLTWTEQIALHTAGTGYSGVWTAVVPSSTLLNNFSGGTNGTTLSTANTGGASGNAIDNFEVFGTSTGTFTNAVTHISPFSAAMTAPVSSQSDFSWTTSLTNAGLPQAWFRAYVNLSTVADTLNGLQWLNQAGATCGQVYFNGSSLQLLDSGGSFIVGSALTLPANSWFRLEGYCTGSSVSGQMELKTFLSPDSATPDETITTANNINTSGLIFGMKYGIRFNNSATTPATMNLTYIGVTNLGYLGPVPGGATAISVSDFAGQVESIVLIATVPVFDQVAMVESTPAVTATVPWPDFAAMVEAAGITATVPVSDYAGVVDTPTVLATLAVTDVAAQAETPAITASVPVSDYAAMVEHALSAVSVSVSDFAAGLDVFLRPGAVANRNLPAIVLMAAAYQGAT